MPAALALSEPHSNVIPHKKNFRTVLAFASPFRPSSDHPPPPRNTIHTLPNPTHRTTRSVADSSFFDSQSTSIVDLTLDDMKTLDAVQPPRRAPVRIDTDGPWSVSVAETPNDSRSYSLYIKTPTHNLTLTRTAMEILDLDTKLREAHPDVKIPSVPIDITTLPSLPPKKKSTFLNTLSRLASPTSSKSNRSSTRRAPSSSTPSTLPTPLTSPSGEIGDPFSSFTSTSTDASGTAPPTSTTSTAIAAYLTTVSNTAALRQARVWKRFVRVRTDDLESVRVERAIKRVRSDLAAHGGSSKDKEKEKEKETAHVRCESEKGSILVESVNGRVEDAASVVSAPREDRIKEEEEGEEETNTETKDADVATVAAADGTSQPVTEETKQEEETASPADDTASTAAAEDVPTTPLATDVPPQSRMQRSQSADPDKSSRLSRVYASSQQSQDALSSQAETGDESSISTRTGSGRASERKKRSRSTAPKEPKKSQRKVVINDFEMMRVLGKGCAGKVLLVRHKTTSDLFALKAITKRHVLAHQELQHTLTEQAVLKRMAAESRDPFVVKLWWSFHDKENLFLVMDFHPGGDLATQLARWGRLGRDRARFYAAEIVEGVEGLHAAGVIYRDLKPENILIGADGHIVLTDFGLSKEFPRKSIVSSSAPMTPRGTEFYSSVPGAPQPATPPWMKPDKNGDLALGWPGQPIGHSDQTTTFCGTAEYLAPEVIQGLPYSYEVDWWSFGTMLYEMLTGITPFWANNHSDMYVRVLQDELQFPDDRAIDQDTKSLIRGLLQRNPALRICEPRIKRHPYFSMIDWSHVYYKRYIPPYIPPIDPSNASDTQNFDDTFLDMEPVLDEYTEETTDNDGEGATDTDRTDGDETNTTPSQSRSSSVRPAGPQGADDDTVDVFDGYSFKGRHSVIIDGDDDEDEDTGSEGDSDYGEDEDDSSILKGVDEVLETAKPELPEEEAVEPKTPEARPAVVSEPVPEDISELPPPGPIEEPEPVAEVAAKPSLAVETAVEEAKPQKSKDLPASPGTPDTIPPPPVPAKEAKKVTVQAKPTAIRPAPVLTTRNRREKSGVAALDRFIDDDTELTTEAERDDEDDDWDFVEAVEGEDRNGAKGTSLFARGVVDRYRLAVFRKASTPSQRSQPRSFSGMSKNSDATASEAESPNSQRRGRAALAFRKNPRQFLQPKTPPSSYSSKTSMSARSGTPSTSNTMLASSSSGGLLSSPSPGGTLAMAPSLKSKESAMSVGAQSLSSDQSVNGVASEAQAANKGSSPQQEEPEKQKTKKLKKYKENAEKVFSLFSSPRPSQQPLGS